MKKRIFLAVALACSALSAWAQTYTVTPSATSYSSAGGNLTFTVSLAYPATVSTVSFGAKPPAASWKYVSVGGTNVPGLAPVANDTTDPADSGSIFGFTYLSDPNTGLLPTSPVSFTFVLNYPAGLTGNQVITFRGDYRNAGVLTPVTVASVTLTAAPEAASIITQPASVSVTAGQNATFTVVAGGSPTPTLQWQRSTDAGATWNNVTAAPYSGVTTSTLTVTGVTLAMNNDRFRVNATNTNTATSNGTATLTVTQAPVITQQPVAQSSLAGGSVTFSLTATGSGTLTYQWYFTPASTTAVQTLAGATSSSLTLNNVQTTNVGDYVCIVSNGVLPNATSNAVQLTLTERLVRVASQTAAPSSTVVVPIQLVAKGDENAVSFTLEYPAAKLTYTDSTITGTDSSTGNLVKNVTQATSGKLSFAISKQSGEVYAAGTRVVLNITFTVAAGAVGGDVIALTFTDSLAVRKIANASSTGLPGPFVDGSITVSSGLEGDVNGDGVVDLSDWVKLGRLVVGLDAMPAAGATFMKVDCAPRTTKGDGLIDLSDWVQAGRFVVGLDVPPPAGGPTGPTP